MTTNRHFSQFEPLRNLAEITQMLQEAYTASAHAAVTIVVRITTYSGLRFGQGGDSIGAHVMDFVRAGRVGAAARGIGASEVPRDLKEPEVMPLAADHRERESRFTKSPIPHAHGYEPRVDENAGGPPTGTPPPPRTLVLHQFLCAGSTKHRRTNKG